MVRVSRKSALRRVDRRCLGWHGDSMKTPATAAFFAAFLFVGAEQSRAAGEMPPAPDAGLRAGWTGPTFTFGAATSFVFDINQPDHQLTHENQKTYADG